VWPSLVYYCPDGYSRITKKEECTSVVATALGKSLGVDQAVDAFPHGCYSGVDFWAVHFNTGEEGLRGGVAPVCQRPNPCEDVTCDLGGACDWTEGICKTTTTTTTTTISKTNGVVSSHECSTGVGSPCPAGFSESDVLGCCDCLAGTHLYGDNCVETCPDGFLQNENANGCEPSRQCVAYSAGSCPRNCVVLDEACQEPTPGESDSTSNDTASEQSTTLASAPSKALVILSTITGLDFDKLTENHLTEMTEKFTSYWARIFDVAEETVSIELRKGSVEVIATVTQSSSAQSLEDVQLPAGHNLISVALSVSGITAAAEHGVAFRASTPTSTMVEVCSVDDDCANTNVCLDNQCQAKGQCGVVFQSNGDCGRNLIVDSERTDMAVCLSVNCDKSNSYDIAQCCQAYTPELRVSTTMLRGAATSNANVQDKISLKSDQNPKGAPSPPPQTVVVKNQDGPVQGAAVNMEGDVAPDEDEVYDHAAQWKLGGFAVLVMLGVM